MSTATEPFGKSWAVRKLDMPRRRLDLTAYIDRWLPELREAEPGLVLDVGCGPGDFLDLCREMGHDVLGIDAPDGDGGMGDAYLSESEKWCQKLNVPVAQCRLLELLSPPSETARRTFSWEQLPECSLACVNMRGSIEQALGELMIGEPHDIHHDCRLLDWDTLPAESWIYRLLTVSEDLLRPGGILLIHANGTKSTDAWYDETIRAAADALGLELAEQQGLLLHKWVKR